VHVRCSTPPNGISYFPVPTSNSAVAGRFSSMASMAVGGYLWIDAADLNLSPSAVSRQIQSLETHLGVTLFRRLNLGLEITEAGRRYLETVNRVLGELRRAQERLAALRSGPLRVSALESFTESWLVPHLSDFERAHPGIELQVEATLRYADFERDPVDVAIRFGTGPWGDLHSEPIVDLTYFPVCSPRSAASHPCESPAICARTRSSTSAKRPMPGASGCARPVSRNCGRSVASPTTICRSR
jgi:DNA-binding transcriptional LysR family regulator